MVDGTASLMALIHGMLACGFWNDQRGVNLVDSGAHFYDTYETADGEYVSIGSIEPQFYQELLRLAWWEELPHAAIAYLLGCSPNAATHRIQRAAQRVAKEYQRLDHGRSPAAAHRQLRGGESS